MVCVDLVLFDDTNQYFNHSPAVQFIYLFVCCGESGSRLGGKDPEFFMGFYGSFLNRKKSLNAQEDEI